MIFDILKSLEKPIFCTNVFEILYISGILFILYNQQPKKTLKKSQRLITMKETINQNTTHKRQQAQRVSQMISNLTSQKQLISIKYNLFQRRNTPQHILRR